MSYTLITSLILEESFSKADLGGSEQISEGIYAVVLGQKTTWPMLISTLCFAVRGNLSCGRNC